MMRYDDRSAELRTLEYLEAAGNASREEIRQWTDLDEDDVHEAVYRLREDDVVFEYGADVMISWRVPDPADVRDVLADAETAVLYSFIKDNDEATHTDYDIDGVPLSGILEEYGIEADDPFMPGGDDGENPIYGRLRDLETAGLIDRKGFDAACGNDVGWKGGVMQRLVDLLRSGGSADREVNFEEAWGDAGAVYTAAEISGVHEQLLDDLLE